tara:strand:- start:2128 stop:2838 length:711 start_codon:yes stop_codon:yes gene_type:complete
VNDGSEDHTAEQNARKDSLFLRLVSRDLGEPFAEFRSRFQDLTNETNLFVLRESLAELSEPVYRLDRLIRDLVDTAAIESGELIDKAETVDLAALLSEQISKRLRRLHGYRFQPEIPSSALHVTGDKARLATLINDLLDAVILFSPEGGTILARLSRDEDNICISTENRAAHSPPAGTGTILEWLDACLQEAKGFEGVGIGLYRSYLTARFWGGELNVVTPPGGGVSFTLCIPYKK